MKISKLMIVSSSLIALALIIPTAAALETGSTWVVVADLELDQHTFVAGFTSPATGITSGYGGATYVTEDGGETWTTAENESACRYGLDIVDEALAWTAGNGGHVRRSTDGGLTWEAVENVGYSGISNLISFADDQNGWVASQSKLWATTDGGATWTEVPLLDEMAHTVAAVSLLNTDEGYIFTYTRTLYHTTDGGQTWDSLAIVNLQNRKLQITALPALRMFDAEQGMLIVQFKDKSSLVLRTEDGGQTWTEETLPVEVASNATYVLSRDGQLVTITVSHGNQARVVVVQVS